MYDKKKRYVTGTLRVWTANVTGSSGYWYENSKNLTAITEETGSWTCFKTWSAADSHWRDLFRILTGKDSIPTKSERYNLHIKHPLIVGDLFKIKFLNFFKH